MSNSPQTSKPVLPRPVYHVSFRYPHHASLSSYDRLTDFIGEAVPLSRSMHLLGETLLRLPAKLTSWYGGSFEYSRHDFVMEAAVMSHMLKHRDSMYHFFNGEKSYKLSGFLNNRRGHRMIATFHHPPSHFSWLFRSTDHLKRLSHAIVLSTNQLEFMETLIGKGRVTFIPHGIDTDYFQPPADEPRPDRPPRCIFAGRHMRDFERLQEIVSGILDAVPQVEFFLVSTDKSCERIAASNRVRWLRAISDSEYLDTLRQSDLMVLPLVESVAVNSVFEAMACGVPVVTNEGGVSDYLDPASGVMLPVGNVKDMVNTAVGLLQDHAARRNMARAARRRALEFSWPRIAKQTAELYSRIVQEA